VATLSTQFQAKGAKHLFHFTDSQNVPLIKRYGLLSLAEMNRLGVRSPAPGGNELSHDLDVHLGLDKYVHLCHRANHSMCFAANQDGRIPNPVWLKIHLAILDLNGVAFTLDVSNKSGVSLISASEVLSQLDWEVLHTRMNWKDPAVKDRLDRAERAEVLIPNHIPPEYIGCS
jgi:hypothetical protein